MNCDFWRKVTKPQVVFLVVISMLFIPYALAWWDTRNTYCDAKPETFTYTLYQWINANGNASIDVKGNEVMLLKLIGEVTAPSHNDSLVAYYSDSDIYMGDSNTWQSYTLHGENDFHAQGTTYRHYALFTAKNSDLTQTYDSDSDTETYYNP